MNAQRSQRHSRNAESEQTEYFSHSDTAQEDQLCPAEPEVRQELTLAAHWPSTSCSESCRRLPNLSAAGL